jgi:deoxyribodipyrimidine photo-lyase
MEVMVNVFWFRRDLRLYDNHGLFKALQAGLPILPLFVFDKDILDGLDDRNDRRVTFIYDAILTLQKELAAVGSTLFVYYGTPRAALAKLAADYKIEAVFANEDYEPYATRRDSEISNLMMAKGIRFELAKDQVIFEKSEVAKNDGLPYGMYAPYSKKWKAALTPAHIEPFKSETLMANFYRQPAKEIISLEAMGFTRHPDAFPGNELSEQVVQLYHQQRDFPALAGTSRMGVHLRFGTVSVRQLAAAALKLNATFLGELIWREFFMQTLWHHPRLVHECSRKEYELVQWRNDQKSFAAWCAGKTGYPIVDAGMRELDATGFMHNRVRMVAASFLVKHLLIDWRLGEHYFAQKLLDYELASNIGNWQWVAGCGCDAAPYFRIFNPAAQAKKFDPQEVYIRKWVPEYGTKDYVAPIVVHETARQRCIEVYKKALAAKYTTQTNKLSAG